MSLQVLVNEKDKGIFVIEPVGEVNTQTYQELENKVNAAIQSGAQAIAFELKGMSYISSMGLSVFFRAKQRLEKNGGTIALVNLQPQIKTIFETVKVLPDQMFASLEQADEYLDSFLDGVQKGRITPKNPSGF